jgi:hypothetical protein
MSSGLEGEIETPTETISGSLHVVRVRYDELRMRSDWRRGC